MRSTPIDYRFATFDLGGRGLPGPSRGAVYERSDYEWLATIRSAFPYSRGLGGLIGASQATTPLALSFRLKTASPQVA